MDYLPWCGCRQAFGPCFLTSHVRHNSHVFTVPKAGCYYHPPPRKRDYISTCCQDKQTPHPALTRERPPGNPKNPERSRDWPDLESRPLHGYNGWIVVISKLNNSLDIRQCLWQLKNDPPDCRQIFLCSCLFKTVLPIWNGSIFR